MGSEGTRRRVHHPLFARLLVRVNERAEAAGRADHRRELLAGLSGRVVEVGAGDGLNIAHYPDSVDEVVAVEPEPYLRERARKAVSQSDVPVRVVDGVAERLPAADREFDAGVLSSVLCSVLDVEATLAELHRILRPGGELRFYEHVRADTAGFERPRLARAQRMLDATIWPRVAGGCHASRDAAAAIGHAGFRIEASRSFLFTPSPLMPWVAPHVIGLARRA